LQSQWYHANTFLPLKEENLYNYNSKNDPEMAGPKVSIIKRFHCISNPTIIVAHPQATPIPSICIVGIQDDRQNPK